MPDIRVQLFSWRGYIPIPFLAVMLLFAEPTGMSMLFGGAAALVGEFIRFWGVAYAGSLTRVTGGVGAPQVVVAGPFAYVRNPLYLGNTLLYAGCGAMSMALWPWLPIVALVYFSVQYWLIVTLEEEFLADRFGPAYLEFKRNVPRFLPRFVPWQHPSQEGQHPDWKEAARSERRTFQAIAIVCGILIFMWASK
ncbi:MAG: hypothetical protein A2X67_10640 [Ignavibacteria bacterium GWA2_55_11]|nr:MAG: hypothetical protein A2X67_10640 [Ignavibacteria bacterium GWA2_55_11]OGU71736.1 MAG: hypothetical protein A3H45_04445 [Ignavibacteria bacterium RIFCSPLOWO2_02_FULL_55_14]